jgi:tRNA(fMet)-specific endonuclease VapC
LSFLLDTDTCSEHLKRPSGLSHRFTQYSGRLSIPSIVLAELYAWAHLRPDPMRRLSAIGIFIKYEVAIIPFDRQCAEWFGQLRGILRRKGIAVQPVDLMIAAAALAHDLTLVTHNTADFQHVPNLRLEDWVDS